MFRFIPRKGRQKPLRRDTINGELLSCTLDSCEVDDLPLNLRRRRFHECAHFHQIIAQRKKRI